VIGDFYHRYTVDEHSFAAIDHLHHLRDATNDTDRRFHEILSELDKPESVFMALLLHDIGKGTSADHHVHGSVVACDRVCARLDVDSREHDDIRFLIANHLAMSATLMRRDIFDPHTIATFAAKVVTAERLKMLCLLTYADISAVSPDTMTPWKAELLWQLYAATANYLLRSVDSDRVKPGGDEAGVRDSVGEFATPEIAQFLRGLPRRYIALHSPAEIAEHCRLAQLLEDTAAQVSLTSDDHGFELTVITRDRLHLFVAFTGILAAWGMNVLKVDAFANASGIIVDVFRFTDRFGTLTLNPSEAERFKRELLEILSRDITPDTLRWLGDRVRRKVSPAKVHVATRVWFDDGSSEHSTIVEIVTRDRPGLLYDISSVLSELMCNIEVALIDTEGQKAIDVIYLTHDGRKLDKARQHELRAALLSRL
jgi:[protein-PII] uridylyltransferase